jgi:DNA segregation ATPase FtsK/SpoIIIE, S-DNA-T family
MQMTLPLQQSKIPNLPPEQLTVVAKIATRFVELNLQAKPLVDRIKVGPIITVYPFVPFGATKVAQLESIAEDLAIALGVEDVLVKRMPGEPAVSICVPNTERKLVTFRQSIDAVWQTYRKAGASFHANCAVPLNLGVTHLGSPMVDDLTQLPHLLVAGQTGGGKSTWLSSALASIVYVCPPSEVKLVLSDTKQVEFVAFADAPHLLFPRATSVYQTLEQLQWCIDEVERRLKQLSSMGFHNINERKAAGCSSWNMPYVVVVIDELADLLCNEERMGSYGKGDNEGDGDADKRRLGKIAESKIGKIVQKARAAGVHLIAATQRPSVDVIRGSIKANFPARLAFKLPSNTDSRTVLSGHGGAEHLLGKGDMLYQSPTRPGLTRLHSPYTSREDIAAAIAQARIANDFNELKQMGISSK